MTALRFALCVSGFYVISHLQKEYNLTDKKVLKVSGIIALSFIAYRCISHFSKGLLATRNLKVISAGKIVRSSEQSKIGVMFRYPIASDAAMMRNYINRLSLEKTFIRQQGEQVSLEEEEKYLNSQLEKIAGKKAVQLLVFHEQRLIGIAEVQMQSKTEQHVGVLAISIAKEFRGQGIGKLLTKALIKEAVESLPTLQIITLSVFSTNTAAIHIYQQCGFQECGRLPKGVQHQEEYVDLVQMYQVVR